MEAVQWWREQSKMPVAFVDRGSTSILGEIIRSEEAPPTVNSYEGRVNRAHNCFERAQQHVLTSLLPSSLREQASQFDSGAQVRVTGPQRLERIRYALRAIGLTYSDDQREFINRMIAAAARLIFKDDLQQHVEDLLAELGIKELQQELMAIMPRRFGKTFSCSAFVVALLFAIEGIEIGIFSTGRRASQKFLELVYWFLTKLGGMNIIKHNVETIWIQGPYGKSDVRKVSSYPSNVRISPLFLFFFFFWCVFEWRRAGER